MVINIMCSFVYSDQVIFVFTDSYPQGVDESAPGRPRLSLYSMFYHTIPDIQSIIGVVRPILVIIFCILCKIIESNVKAL
jgi:hypothetical protein